MGFDIKAIQAVHTLRVEAAQAAALAAPSTNAHGVSLATWKVRTTPTGFSQAVIALNADGAANVTDAKLYGYGPYGEAGADTWVEVGALNNGDAIALSATMGFAQIMQFPGVFSRLAVGGTVSANNVGYTATPITEFGNI